MAEKDYIKGMQFGHDIDTSFVRLDLYRLNCIFEASKPMSSQCDDLSGCPIRSMLDDWEKDEISRLVVSISIFGRLIDEKFTQRQEAKVALPSEEWLKWLKAPVGTLIPEATKTNKEPLVLREAFNKIIHAKKMNFDVVERKPYSRRYLRPILYLYGTKGKKEWKATLNVRPFIQRAWELACQM